MAKAAIGDVYVELGTGTVNISDRVKDCKVSLGRSAVDVSAVGDAWAGYVTGGVGRWAVTLGLYQDYTTDSTGGIPVYSLIKQLMAATTGTPILIRPTSGVVTDHNPEISGNVVLEGDFDMMTAAVNTANAFSVTLKGMGAPTFDETAT
jgi:hypothetical protein